MAPHARGAARATREPLGRKKCQALWRALREGPQGFVAYAERRTGEADRGLGRARGYYNEDVTRGAGLEACRRGNSRGGQRKREGSTCVHRTYGTGTGCISQRAYGRTGHRFILRAPRIGKKEQRDELRARRRLPAPLWPHKGRAGGRRGTRFYAEATGGQPAPTAQGGQGCQASHRDAARCRRAW